MRPSNSARLLRTLLVTSSVILTSTCGSEVYERESLQRQFAAVVASIELIGVENSTDRRRPSVGEPSDDTLSIVTENCHLLASEEATVLNAFGALLTALERID